MAVNTTLSISATERPKVTLRQLRLDLDREIGKTMAMNTATPTSATCIICKIIDG
ncbi:hypothetical protein [Rhodobium gokarnense]|uniref:Uncharacterized protein n=1 Tax=Rhodobium gokarnense TaxID=364296 RepID=A0ABT3HGF3_9HYPH|nr:hypothetical protein [Rhodobium gokarnense]MCW2309455.1 hypothetical protein [Rhodobium gokarnense]